MQQIAKTCAQAVTAFVLTLLVAGCVTGGPAPPEALRSRFPETTEVASAELENPPAGLQRLLVARNSSGAVGYGAVMRVVSKSGPFTILVLTDAEPRVKEVRVLSYPHARGGQVRRADFRQQFVGKGPLAPLAVGEDIDAVSGATISSTVMSQGVRRTLAYIRDEWAAEG